MLQSARALMFSKGYRAVGERQHATTVQFMRKTLSYKFKSILEFMDMMRRKRNRTVYDIAGLISSKEALEAIETAKIFVEEISRILNLQE